MKIKKLEWTYLENSRFETWYSSTHINDYIITKTMAGFYILKVDEINMVDEYGLIEYTEFEKAKQKAQEIFESIIKGYLE